MSFVVQLDPLFEPHCTIIFILYDTLSYSSCPCMSIQKRHRSSGNRKKCNIHQRASKPPSHTFSDREFRSYVQRLELSIKQIVPPLHSKSFHNLASALNVASPPTADANEFRKTSEVKLKSALFSGWAPRTDANYTNAVIRFIKFASKCDPAQPPLPASPHMVCLWLAEGLGRTGPDLAKGNLSALAAWHRAAGLPFKHPPQARLIKNALRLAWPKEKQRKEPRKPISPDMIRALHASWSNGGPRELAALAIAKASWSGQLRLSETIPETISKLDRSRIPTRSDWHPSSSIPNASSLHLPWTKVTRFKGATVTLLHQDLTFDATRAVERHLAASPLPDRALLCEYLVGGMTHILDKKTFMSMCNLVWSSYGWPPISGHSFRIGGTTSLLVSGVDPTVVKKMGRWSSDAYLRYWRTVEEIFHIHASNVNFKNFDI
jgi:hypothetical protein